MTLIAGTYLWLALFSHLLGNQELFGKFIAVIVFSACFGLLEELIEKEN